MKQKFTMTKSGAKEMQLQELSELEKNKYSVVYEYTYNLQDLRKAPTESGSAGMLTIFRNTDFFPPEPVAKKLAAAAAELIEDSNRESAEIEIDDNQLLQKEEEIPAIDVGQEKAASEDLDEILDDGDDIVVDDDEE